MLSFIKAKWMLIVTGLGIAMAFTIKILLGIVGRQKHEIKMKDVRHELGEKQNEFVRQHELEEQKENEELQDYVVGMDVNKKWDGL